MHCHLTCLLFMSWLLTDSVLLMLAAAKGRDALDDDLLAWKAQGGQSSADAAAAPANPDQDETMAEAAE